MRPAVGRSRVIARATRPTGVAGVAGAAGAAGAARVARIARASVGASVALADADDAEEFSAKYVRLHGRLVAHAERLLSREDARDAAAQTCAEIWYRWSQLTPEQRSDRYFFGAVHKTAIDMFKAQRLLVSLDEAEEQLDRMVEREVELPTRADTAADILDLTLATMPARRREVFQLIREDGFSYEETAEQLGLSLGTIRTHYRLATGEIRAALRRAGIRVADRKAACPPAREGGATL